MEAAAASSSRGRTLARIAASTLAGVWFALTLTFLLFQTHSPAPGLPDETQAQIRQEFGLDQPMAERYVSFLTDVVRGDLGTSSVAHEPVLDIVRRYLARSSLVALSAVVVALVAARVLAVAVARRPDGRVDRSVMAVCAVLASLPFHYVVIGLLLFGAYTVHVLPGTGYRSDPTASGWAAVWDVVRHAALPVLSIALSLVGRFTMVVRAHLLDRLEWTGEALRSRRVRRRAFRETWGRSVRSVAGRVGFILSALIVVESVAAWRGAGGLLGWGISNGDYPVVRGIFLGLVVPAVALACAIRTRWTGRGSAQTLSSPLRDRAVRAGLLLSAVWIAFALLAPVVLAADQRTMAWAAAHGAPISAPPLSTCGTPLASCPNGEHHVWLLGTDSMGVSNLQIAWEDRSRLGFVASATALGVLLGAVVGMLVAVSPRVLGSMLEWVVDAVTAVPFMLVLIALIAVPRGTHGSKVALALMGAGLVARPVAEMWRAPGAGGRARLRALAAGSASLASFVFFAAAMLPFSWIHFDQDIPMTGWWFSLALLAANAALPVVGLRLVAHGLLARRRTFAPGAGAAVWQGGTRTAEV
ncbi:MAG: ABC transporter permease subunit [Actinomycetota bacterium]